MVRAYSKLYVGGQWVAPAGDGTIHVVNPANGKVVATVPRAQASDADAAVLAAQAAFPGWASTSRHERSRLLHTVADELLSRREEVAQLITEELGMPLQQSVDVQAAMPIENFRYYAELAGSYSFEEQPVGNSRVFREPIGVVACITPWNFPLHQVVIKVAAAMAAGCTVVLKPSELAPSTAFLLAELIDRAGLPAGVFNLVTGFGPEAGEPLVVHPQVQMISFTGSTAAGRRIASLAADQVKKISLELGGKSPNLILRSADLRVAVADGVRKCFSNSGQGCTALSRMIVPAERADEVAAIAAETAASLTVGDPLDPATDMGPLVSEQQRRRVTGYIEAAVREGARLVTGGPENPRESGFFVNPTVFTDVTSEMAIAREEVFGPVLAILSYNDEEDGLAIANDTPYGLAAGVWAATPEEAIPFARRIQAGQVEINGGQWNGRAPFGGFKQSGIGREAGPWGFEEFLELKALQF